MIGAILGLIVTIILAIVLIKLLFWAAGIVIALIVGVAIYFLAERLVGRGR